MIWILFFASLGGFLSFFIYLAVSTPKWVGYRKAGYIGCGMGADEGTTFRFLWEAKLDRWAYLTINLFPGHLNYEIERYVEPRAEVKRRQSIAAINVKSSSWTGRP